jgi:TetR/AcrR family transcriptional regulator
MVMSDNDAKLKLMEAALPLFATKGYSAVSIKEISEAAGVNSALINYYFKSKDGLYTAVVASQFDKFRTMILRPDLEKLEPIERIRQFILNFIRLHQANPYIRRLMTSEINQPSPCFEQFGREYLSKFSAVLMQTIEEGIAKGQFRDDLNPNYMIVAIIGMVNYYFVVEQVATKYVFKGKFEDQDSFGMQIVQICMEGILRPGYQKNL